MSEVERQDETRLAPAVVPRRYLWIKRASVGVAVLALAGGTVQAGLVSEAMRSANDPELALETGLAFIRTVPIYLGLGAAGYAFIGHGLGYFAPYMVGLPELWREGKKLRGRKRFKWLMMGDATRVDLDDLARLHKSEIERIGIVFRFMGAFLGLYAASAASLVFFGLSELR